MPHGSWGGGEMARHKSCVQGNGTGGSEEKAANEWPGVGRRLDVVRLRQWFLGASTIGGAHASLAFVGVFIPARGTPHIWELESDAHLHNQPPSTLYMPLRMPRVQRPGPATSNASPTKKPPLVGSTAAPAVHAVEPSAASSSACASSAIVTSAPGETATLAATSAPRGSSRRHQLFDDLYRPSSLTSFDEILSRPYAQPVR
eukprot:scaffold197683_cov31-Tisochrysis_lutea.AAC.4